MTEQINSNVGTSLPAIPDEEARNLYVAAHSRVPILKFRKGKYYVGAGDGEEVPAGTRFVAYAADWRRGWRKWRDEEIVEDRVVRVADDPREPRERDELDDRDESTWETGLDGEPKDPWTLINELPVEDVASGERLLFSSSSFGGKIAIEKVAGAYATNLRRKLDKGLPTIKLAVAEMKTKAYGKVPRPDFPVVGWERNDVSPIVDITPKFGEPMDDEIPF